MSTHRYQSLLDQLTRDIRSGKLSPGHRLPTHREFAHREGVALGTATRVFNALRTAGLISGEVGRGTFVRTPPRRDTDGFVQSVDRAPDLDLVFNQSVGRAEVDVLRSSLKLLSGRGALDDLLLYQPHGGQMEDRRIVARWLLRQGVPAAADTSVIVGGAQHGLAIAALALLKPGDVVAVDALTYPGFKAVADLVGLELVSVSGADGRTSADALDAMCRQRRVRAAYLMPTVHNPLGFVLDEAERNALCDVARQHDLLVIEDGAYAFLEPDAPAPLAARLPDHCVYVTSLSKNVATGLRCGFLHAPVRWIPKIEKAIQATIWNVPGLLVTIATQWLTDGTAAAAETRKRREGKKRQRRFSAGLRHYDYLAHPNGSLAWLVMPETVRATDVAEDLAGQGITVATAEAFAVTPRAPQAIRLAMGHVAVEQIGDVATTIRAAIERARDG